MGKGLGFAAFGLAASSLFATGAGFFMALGALALASAAGLFGGRLLVVASGLTASTSALLSPSMLGYAHGSPWLVASLLLLLFVLSAAPFLAIIADTRLSAMKLEAASRETPAGP